VTLLAKEIRACWAAMIYFTRVPMPALPSPGDADWERAAMYFPLIGYGVGAVVVGLWWCASRVFPPAVASGLCLAGGMLLTGAMHEDGLADFCDGFGGGWTKEKILEIMRDSRTGVFGVVALIMTLGLKWQTIAALPRALIPLSIIASQSVSRSGSISLMATLDYAGSANGKARPLSSRMSLARLSAALIIGLLPLIWLPAILRWSALPALVLRLLAGPWFERRIGGYTGDCLGAVQQLGELAFLLTALALV
jgi:adenosylcobinamide-GDP ribazoletransferase